MKKIFRTITLFLSVIFVGFGGYYAGSKKQVIEIIPLAESKGELSVSDTASSSVISKEEKITAPAKIPANAATASSKTTAQPAVKEQTQTATAPAKPVASTTPSTNNTQNPLPETKVS